MENKKIYIRPEVDIIKLQTSSLLAGSQTHWVDAKQDNPDWEDEDEDWNTPENKGWLRVGYDSGLKDANTPLGD